ncbi:MAG: hypothetical protein N3D84_00275 [Candidatus Woesearchaeota archaeon]|nr:hypothetical protein [Candidatus Woesearchaeota archaeon]
MKNPFRITTTREKLEPLLNEVNYKWGDYTRERQKALDELIKAGLLVMPQFNSTDRAYEKQMKVIEAILNIKEKITKNKEKISQIVVIPHEAHIIPAKDLSDVNKKFPLVVLRPNEDETLKDQLSRKIKNISIEDTIVGYDWQTANSNDRRYFVTSLTDCYKGHFLSLMEHSAIKNISVETKFYETGNIVVEKIPSLSTRRLYKMNLIGFLAFSKGENINPDMTFMFNTTHYCEKNLYNMIKTGRLVPGLFGRSLSFRRGREKYECYHSALALKLASKALEKEHGKILYDPFIEPKKEETKKIFDAMRKYVLCEDSERNFYLPNDVITEIVLWKYIGYINEKRKETIKNKKI